MNGNRNQIFRLVFDMTSACLDAMRKNSKMKKSLVQSQHHEKKHISAFCLTIKIYVFGMHQDAILRIMNIHKNVTNGFK